jgi:hypothetical protein
MVSPFKWPPAARRAYGCHWVGRARELCWHECCSTASAGTPFAVATSMATLDDVARTYNHKRSLGLTPQEIADLAQYLKSL